MTNSFPKNGVSILKGCTIIRASSFSKSELFDKMRCMSKLAGQVKDLPQLISVKDLAQSHRDGEGEGLKLIIRGGQVSMLQRLDHS